MRISAVIFVVLVALAAAESESYKGFKVYKVPITSEKDSLIIGDLFYKADSFGADFWTNDRAIGSSNDIMVAPYGQRFFEIVLKKSNIAFEVVIEDFELYLKEQEQLRLAEKKEQRPAGANALDLSRYYEYEEMLEHLSELAQANPNTVSLGSAGISHENRTIPVLVVDNGDNKRDKPTIIIDAGIHAREWIAPATALYAIEQLVNNAAEHADLLQHFNFVFIPLVNPDGYKHTHDNTRMWRKNRRPSTTCIGVDGNRNYAYEWGGEGSSGISCSDTYRGPTPLSEPETQAVANVLTLLSDVAISYMSLHSYGSYLLYPWGYNLEKAENWEDLEAFCNAGADAVRNATGNNYQVGPSGALLYPAAGGSDDWALAVANIPYSITVELPRGGSGFDPPPSQIEELVKESWIMLKAMSQHLLEKYV